VKNELKMRFFPGQKHNVSQNQIGMEGGVLTENRQGSLYINSKRDAISKGDE